MRVVDLETSGLLSGYKAPRTTVRLSEFALYSATTPFQGGFTDILLDPLREFSSIEDYHSRLIASGWDPAVARRGDVVAGVHARQLAATKRYMAGKGTLVSEKEVLRQVGSVLGSGERIGAWNVEFDLGVLQEIARKQGDKSFLSKLSGAYKRGKIVEMADPARRFLFNLAREGDIELGFASRAAKGYAARPGATAAEIGALGYKQMMEPHAGFQKLFRDYPRINYEEYRSKLAAGSLEEMLGVQKFSAGLRRPDLRYVRGWKQQVLAETISPGFLENPTRTQLGQEMAKRLQLSQGEKVTAHLARDDTVLSSILHGIFESKDPWKELEGYGVRSRGQFVSQYKSALEMDLHEHLKTYLGENSKRAMDHSYLRKLMSGADELAKRAPDVAEAAGTSARRWPGLQEIGRGTINETKAAVAKYPRAATAAAVIGGVLLAGAFIPQDNRLEGRRHEYSSYQQINGISYGGIGAAATYGLTDFGSGRSRDNVTSQVSAWRLARSQTPPAYRGYSVADVRLAQGIWAGAKSQRNKRQFDKAEYHVRKGSTLSIPGVRPDAWVGIVDLKDYKVKAEDADTLSLYRRGLLHMFDRAVSVRMAGIDAPESHPQWPFGMQPGGIESGEYLTKLLEHQETLKLLIDPRRTTYGRHIGVVSGDVHPNINLKLVSAGVAGRLPGYKGITTSQAYAKAEAIAAASGLGMWSSKGWQAKRMMDLSANKVVTNTSLQNLDRIAGKMDLAEYSDLVQYLHNSPKEKPWEEGEVGALSQVMAVRQNRRMHAVNYQIKQHGWTPGIRQAISPWDSVRPGISPSQLPGANVSAFGSGRSDELAEVILRAVQPLRRRFIPRAEPIMRPSTAKHYGLSYLSSIRDKIKNAAVMGRVRPGAKMDRRKFRQVLAATTAPGMKSSAAEVVEASSAATAVNLTGPAIIQRKRQAFIASQYSAHAAVMPPWRPLNELPVVKGPGFPGNWQVRAWQTMHAGEMGVGDIAEGWGILFRSLQEKGISKGAARALLKRAGLSKGMVQARNRISQELAPSMKERVGGLWRHIYSGQPIESHALIQKAMGYGAAKGKAGFKYASNFTAGNPKTWGELMSVLRTEYTVKKSLWAATAGKGVSKAGKVAGFIDFMSYVGHPLEYETPSAWKDFGTKRTEKGMLNKAKVYLRGEAGPSKYWQATKAWAARSAGKTAGRVGSSVWRLAGRAVAKTGPLYLGFEAVFAFTESGQYKNRGLGLATELVAGTAVALTYGVTYGAVHAVAGPAGAYVGSAIGGAIGGLVGNAPGAAIGAGIGAATGKLIGHVAAELAYIFALQKVIGDPIRLAGGVIAGRRNSSPLMPDEPFYSQHIPGTSVYGGTDAYLHAGHGIRGRPEFSGFGGGLNQARESKALASTLGASCAKIVGAAPVPKPHRIARTKSRLKPTAGLTNIVLWQNRRRITRGGSKWPVQWENKRKVTVPMNASRMMRSAA